LIGPVPVRNSKVFPFGHDVDLTLEPEKVQAMPRWKTTGFVGEVLSCTEIQLQR